MAYLGAVPKYGWFAKPDGSFLLAGRVDNSTRDFLGALDLQKAVDSGVDIPHVFNTLLNLGASNFQVRMFGAMLANKTQDWAGQFGKFSHATRYQNLQTFLKESAIVIKQNGQVVIRASKPILSPNGCPQVGGYNSFNPTEIAERTRRNPMLGAKLFASSAVQGAIRYKDEIPSEANNYRSCVYQAQSDSDKWADYRTLIIAGVTVFAAAIGGAYAVAYFGPAGGSAGAAAGGAVGTTEVVAGGGLVAALEAMATPAAEAAVAIGAQALMPKPQGPGPLAPTTGTNPAGAQNPFKANEVFAGSFGKALLIGLPLIVVLGIIGDSKSRKK